MSCTPSARRCAFLSILIASSLLGPQGAQASTPPQVLYDVNFEAPTHTVDQVAAVGLGPVPRNTPSSNWFGEPTIRTQTGIMDGQFCRFDQAHAPSTVPYGYPYCQQRFGLSTSSGITEQYSFYRIRFDLLIEGLEGDDEFAMLTESPYTEKLIFTSGHLIREATLPNGIPQTTTIGTYADNTRMFFEVNCDRTRRRWDVYMNGSRLVTEAWSARYGDMNAVRFHLTAYTSTACVDLDNVRIEGMPEPAGLVLFLVAFSLFRRGHGAVPRYR